MYIIAIGWLYVTLLIAANEVSIVAGIISFLFYGLLPCGLLLWMSGTKVRRQRRAYLEAKAAMANESAQTDQSSQPDQTGHTTGDTITPVGIEPAALVDRAHPTTEDRQDTR